VKRDGRRRELGDDRGVYLISVAAEIAGVHPQTLRIYERQGLLAPKRTSGNARRYSERDIARLERIQDLTQRAGVNLAGVKLIMEMQAELDDLRRRTAELEAEVRRARRPKAVPMGPSTATFDIVPLRAVAVFPWQRAQASRGERTRAAAERPEA
jgi:MerR family transcriptional regulator/heat shock protein HspR